MGFGLCYLLVITVCIGYYYSKYAIIQKFGVAKIFFNVFKRSLLCSTRLHLFFQKYSKTLILRNIILMQ